MTESVTRLVTAPLKEVRDERAVNATLRSVFVLSDFKMALESEASPLRVKGSREVAPHASPKYCCKDCIDCSPGSVDDPQDNISISTARRWWW